MSSPPTPPRFVPTLTDIVQAAVASEPSAAHLPPGAAPGEQLVKRVMQRVDLVLERRLREAVGEVILAHTQSLGPQLRDEIERVVRESVGQALAAERSLQPVEK